MTLFGEILGTEKKVTLAASSQEAKPATASTQTQIKRTPSKELEYTRLFDTITFN